jgi:Domain of unknown function (DUF4157)
MRARDQVPGDAREAASRSGGTRLAPGVRRAMETRLGHSFADVRVHSDARAAGDAKALGARAYTVGRDVVFGVRQFAPGTPAGRALLGHELAHVVQQRGPGEGDPLQAEAEAGRAGRAIASGRSLAPVVRTGPQVARQAEGEGDTGEAAEATAVRDVPAIRREFEEEQFSFTRDRIEAATYSIRRGVAELNKLKEADRPPLRTKIHGLERQLADALADNAALLERRIPELEARVAAGEDKTELLEARRELIDNQADLESLKGVFSPATGEAFEETYRSKVAGLHCMGAAYAGLSALTSPAQSDEVKRKVAEKAEAGLARKRPVNLDQFITVMDTASADKLAGPKQRAAWSRRHRRWTPTLETIVRSRVNTKVPGFYFFGLALAEGYHSVMIGVSTWDDPRTLWCDQHGCEVVKGTLDDFARGQLENYPIKYSDWDTYLWQVQPPAAASVLTAPEGKP